jgi:hypothetical protein
MNLQQLKEADLQMKEKHGMNLLQIALAHPSEHLKDMLCRESDDLATQIAIEAQVGKEVRRLVRDECEFIQYQTDDSPLPGDVDIDERVSNEIDSAREAAIGG